MIAEELRPMEKVPNPGQSDPKELAAAEMRERAARALSHFGVKNRGQAEQLLPMWAHYGMLRDEDRELVLDAFGGPPLTTDVPCTEWCKVNHAEVYEDFTRTCSSPDLWVPIRDMWGEVDTDREGEQRKFLICLSREIELETQRVGPVQLLIGDEYVSLKDAVTLAELIYVLPALAGEGEPLT